MAAADQPVKTASRWWNTVLGPCAGDSEPMAHSRTECPFKRQAPHSAQSNERGTSCWGTEPLINKSAVESPGYDLPVTPKANSYPSGDRFEPVMVCRSESPCLVQVWKDRDDYRVPGSVIVKEVGRCSSQPSFQELNSGFTRCGVVGPTSSAPLNGHWECMIRGDAQEYEQYGTYVSQQCVGPADVRSGGPLANIIALGRHALPSLLSTRPAVPALFTSEVPLRSLTH